MANSLDRNPIIIDTAGGGTLQSLPLNVARIRWVGATTAGHQAIIADPVDSKTLWEDICPGSNYSVNEDISMVWPNGYDVTTLGSGILYIYVGRSY